jgi:type II secretory pathway pseudopilin PulG
MLVRKPDDEGLGLVEMVIAIFILALIAVALLPALWNGVAQSSTQAKTATATRYLYSIVDRARESAPNATNVTAWCNSITSMASTGPAGFTTSVDTCTADSSSLVTLTMTATSTGSEPAQLATVTAKVFVQ